MLGCPLTPSSTVPTPHRLCREVRACQPERCNAVLFWHSAERSRPHQLSTTNFASSVRLRFQQLDGVAQLGGALVEFLANSCFHFALHDLELGERPFRFHFLEPSIQKCDLRTSRGQFREI